VTGVSLQAVVPVAKGPAEGGWRALATIPKKCEDSLELFANFVPPVTERLLITFEAYAPSGGQRLARLQAG
jgi:hypothetical protein